MSRIDELIVELAPGGVEVKALGEVGEFIRGNGLQKADLRDAGFPAVHYGQIHTHYGVWATETKSFTDENIAVKLRHARPGDLLIATTSEDDDAVAKATAWLGNTDVALSGDAYIYRHELEPKYVSYFFQSTSFQDQKRRYISGTKVRRVSGDSLAKIRIPVPPLEVQREIVRILDQFTQLEAELEAELEARRRQYEHYREYLLALTEVSEFKTLGDVVRIRNGKDHKHLDGGEIPVYGSGGIMRYVDSSSAQGPSVLIPRKGSLGNLFYVEGPFWNVDTIFSTEIDTTLVEPKFLFHQLSIMKLGEMNQAGGVPSQTQSVLNRLRLAIPPLDEQRRVVSILDKFDALVNDLSVGVPAELAARRKQYEYYRDKLLTFKELAA